MYMSQIDKIIYLPLLLWFIAFIFLLYFIIFTYFLSIFISISKGRIIYIKFLISKCNIKMSNINYILKLKNIIYILINISNNLLNNKI